MWPFNRSNAPQEGPKQKFKDRVDSSRKALESTIELCCNKMKDFDTAIESLSDSNERREAERLASIKQLDSACIDTDKFSASTQRIQDENEVHLKSLLAAAGNEYYFEELFATFRD